MLISQIKRLTTYVTSKGTTCGGNTLPPSWTTQTFSFGNEPNFVGRHFSYSIQVISDRLQPTAQHSFFHEKLEVAPLGKKPCFCGTHAANGARNSCEMCRRRSSGRWPSVCRAVEPVPSLHEDKCGKQMTSWPTARARCFVSKFTKKRQLDLRRPFSYRIVDCHTSGLPGV
jgi:hypothetical protein